MTKMLSLPPPSRRLSSLTNQTLPVDGGAGLRVPTTSFLPRLSCDHGVEEVQLELPESLTGEELPVGKACNVGRAARRGMLLNELVLPSSLNAHRRSMDRSDRSVSGCGTPSRPAVSYESAKPFPRLHQSCSQPAGLLGNADAKQPIPDEEVVQAFFSALHPVRHHNRPAPFRAVYDQLLDDDFVICTSGTTASKAQWWQYWDLLVTSGVRARQLQVLQAEAGMVRYTVELVVGSTVITMQHTAFLCEGRLQRIEGPDATHSSTSGGTGAATAAHHGCPPRPMKLDCTIRSLSHCNLHGC
eukprot:GGOE01043587.1.p1 GENE.GGOE01043587.1~~GGOE01043587.1.p1  ORF type:complete len:307 (+),score=76.33 GGOE01043587.1:24-923(+)